MKTSLADLIAQRTQLDRQIRDAQAAAKSAAIAAVRKLMAEHGLSVSDLTPALTRHVSESARRVAPKYRDPESGSTWSGRGLRPKWLVSAIASGKSLEDFKI